jgi:pSer/pThr/pTyr-binding forkhead associated (FHA) protein
MTTVTFQVVVGVDKGRVFRDLPIPVTIGREEGNVLRLNDERISRFHVKVQVDNGDVILTDLDSTNGTRINGHTVQIRRIQPGDRLGIGRSILLFGSNEQIAARVAAQVSDSRPSAGPAPFIPKPSDATQAANPADFDSDFEDAPDPFWAASDHNLPELPQKLTPSQAARLSEIFDYLHRGLSSATEELDVAEESGTVTISFPDWQKVQAVQMLLARYLRAVSEPDTLIG